MAPPRRCASNVSVASWSSASRSVIGVGAHHSGDGRSTIHERRHGRERAAGRAAPQVGAAGVDAERVGLGVQPAQRLDDIVELRREAGFAAEAVIGGGHHEPGGGQALEEAGVPRSSLAGCPAAVAHPPAAAVDVDDERSGAGAERLGPVHVELERPEALPLGEHDRLLDRHAPRPQRANAARTAVAPVLARLQ